MNRPRVAPTPAIAAINSPTLNCRQPGAKTAPRLPPRTAAGGPKIPPERREPEDGPAGRIRHPVTRRPAPDAAEHGPEDRDHDRKHHEPSQGPFHARHDFYLVRVLHCLRH